MLSLTVFSLASPGHPPEATELAPLLRELGDAEYMNNELRSGR